MCCDYVFANLAGNVVYSDDGSGLQKQTDQGDEHDEALDAAHGAAVIRLTRLNADSDDSGSLVQSPWRSTCRFLPARVPIGLGYSRSTSRTPRIRAEIDAGIDGLYRNLAIGLTALYIVLFGISYTLGRKLRRQVKVNAYMAEHDALTNLPNRALFHRRVHESLRRGRKTGRATTIAIIDLDRFKEVNDTLGHYNGHRLLTALSERMAAHLSGRDALARLGGDGSESS